jgi:hypothetical protein
MRGARATEWRLPRGVGDRRRRQAQVGNGVTGACASLGDAFHGRRKHGSLRRTMSHFNGPFYLILIGLSD